jgi:beta-phosphoglucomutase
LSVGIGEQSVLKEAKFCFPNFLHMDSSFIETLIKKAP